MLLFKQLIDASDRGFNVCANNPGIGSLDPNVRIRIRLFPTLPNNFMMKLVYHYFMFSLLLCRKHGVGRSEARPFRVLMI